MAVDHRQAGAHVAREIEGRDAGTKSEGREGVPRAAHANGASGGTALAEIRKPALAVARQLARRKARVRLLRIVGLLLDAGEVTKCSPVDRVASPVLAARPIARSDSD